MAMKHILGAAFIIVGMVIASPALSQVDLSSVETITQDSPLSFDEVLANANRGDAKAQFNLGIMYRDGTGVSKNYIEAERYLHLSASKDNEDAQIALGTLYYDQRNYRLALQWYLRAFHHGDNTGISFTIAEMYLNGKGVPQNYVEAVRYFRLSATKGNTYAQFNLGWMYYHGEGVQQNYVKAYIWYSLASATAASNAPLRDLAASHLSTSELSQAQTEAARCISSNYMNCD